MSTLPPDRHDQQFHLTERFLRAVARWEDAPHNQPGTDKTWVENLENEWREHYRSAVRVQ